MLDDGCKDYGCDFGTSSSTLSSSTYVPTPTTSNNNGSNNNNGGNGGNNGIDDEVTIGPMPPPACASGGINNCPTPPPVVIYPSTVTLHPLDGNVVSQVPIYNYSYHPPRLIGYRIKSYAYDQLHFSVVNFFLPSDPITFTSFTNDYILKPLLKPGIENLASVGIDFSCPVCAGVLTTVSTADSLNSAITFDAHIRIHDIYFAESPLEMKTPFDQFP